MSYPTIEKKYLNKMSFESCYTASQIQAIEKSASIDQDSFKLMQKAGQAAFKHIQNTYNTNELTIFTGPGNNGGDGYVVASLAFDAGMSVKIYCAAEVDKLSGPANLAYQDCRAKGVPIHKFSNLIKPTSGLIVDAVLGIGVDRDLEGEILAMVEYINSQTNKVVSIDIPTGLDSDSGVVHGTAVKANSTITFIGKKQGLLTNNGLDYAGDITLDRLSIDEQYFSSIKPSTYLLNNSLLSNNLKKRENNTHKGKYGHLVIVGGERGMPGAVIMAALAAFRTGAGLVTVLTDKQHVFENTYQHPEIMYSPIGDTLDNEIIQKADAIVFGPGMSNSAWSMSLLSQLDYTGPIVIDGGGLRVLPKSKKAFNDLIITPHAGEAACLLGVNSEDVQKNRFASIIELSNKFTATTILKGSGSLIHADGETYILPNGNPGMASAGMGDILSGIIGALLANGYSSSLAAMMGAYIHSEAGDRASYKKPVGTMAIDLLNFIQEIMNEY